jgi:hypothetical protein
MIPNLDVQNCITTAFTIRDIYTNMLQMLELSAQCLASNQGIHKNKFFKLLNESRGKTTPE